MRSFNTSGPNIPAEHYTLERSGLIARGVELIQKKHYFTIWAPRQTGKSTYFRLLADAAQEQAIKIVLTNTAPEEPAADDAVIRQIVAQVLSRL